MAGLFGLRRGGPKRREAQAAQRLVEARNWAAITPGALILHIINAYDTSVAGTRAWVQLDGTTDMRHAMFWQTSLQSGQTVAVSSSSGWAVQHARSDVLYVGTRDRTGVRIVLPAGTKEAAERHFAAKRI